MALANALSSVLRVGITGHRKLGEDARVHAYVQAQCVRILDRLRDLAAYGHAGLVAYSALAIGADQLFAEAALGLAVPLVGAIPFEDYPDDFKGPDRPKFEALLARCWEVQRLPIQRRSNRAYLKVGQWLVDQVDCVVTVWNGLPAAGLGGTADIVAYARKKKRLLLRIDPAAAGQQEHP